LWPASPQEAVALQRGLAAQVSQVNALREEPRLVAGVDTSGQDREGRVWGTVALLSWPELAVVEVQRAEGTPVLPYIPGLLAFREVPVLLGALERLTQAPDLILVDGQGMAHPRRFGIACHIGLITQVPTVGCAKSILVGRPGPLGPQRGAWCELADGGEVIGAAVRSKDGITPIYVSVGHRVDLATAVQWALACCRGYRLPEPIRQAHQAAAGRLPEPAPVSRGHQPSRF
jgi:deoxyribonuclease V